MNESTIALKISTSATYSVIKISTTKLGDLYKPSEKKSRTKSLKNHDCGRNIWPTYVKIDRQLYV